MAQVITPPSLGQQEAESKNWYRSEALRKIILELTPLRDEMETGVAAEVAVSAAIKLLGDARVELDPRLKRKRLGGS